MTSWFSKICLLAIVMLVFVSPSVSAQDEQGNFSLLVTPSPLVLTIKPGESTVTDVKIRNNGDKTERLIIEIKSFNINNQTGNININDTAPTDISQWVSFSKPSFDILPGEWFTQNVAISLPKEAGFNYSFALVISRRGDVKPTAGQSAVKGSVAVFTLISVDRPDAKKELQLVEFKSSQSVYEYLPATLNTTIKNTGNTIAQPYGNIFIQRSQDSAKPISVLPVNDAKGYILPGSSRSLASDWASGFPVYATTKEAANAEPTKTLAWNWDNLSQIRIGRYTAKLVAVYNDGRADVPILAETSFWVIPWRIILGAVIVLAILAIGMFTLVKKFIKLAKPSRSKPNDDA